MSGKLYNLFWVYDYKGGELGYATNLTLEKALNEYYDYFLESDFIETYSEEFEGKDFSREEARNIINAYNEDRSPYVSSDYPFDIRCFVTTINGELVEEWWDEDEELDYLYPILKAQLEELKNDF